MIDFSSNNWDSDERTLSVKRFEEALETGSTLFLDMNVYEQILDYYHETADFQKALKLCNMAAEIYSYSGNIFLDKARVLSFLGRTQDALAAIAEAESRQPADPEILINKATIYNDSHNYKKAIQTYEQVLHLGIEDPEFLYSQIGMAYQDLEDYEQAVKTYQKMLRANPTSEEALLELSFCYEELGQPEAAIPYFDRVIDHDPYFYFAWFHLGLLYHKLDQHQKAAQAFEFATLIEHNRRAFFWLGHAYMNLQNYQKAAEAYQEAARDEKHVTAEILSHLGASLERLERYEEALVNYYKAIKLDKNHAAAWYGVGCCLALQERWYEATHYFGRAVLLDGQDADYLIAKGKAEYHVGNIVSSMEAYREAVNLNASNPYAWLDWSLLLYEQGEYEEAADLLQSALDEFPENTKVMYRLVAFLMLSGRYREAVSHLELALFLDYEAHEELYNFFPDTSTQKALYKLVQQYKK